MVFSRYADLIISRPRSIVVVVLCVVVLFGYFAKDIRLDNNFSVLFSTNNADADYRHFFRAEFGPDDALLVAVIDTQKIDRQTSVALVESISAALKTVAYFKKIDSITETSVIWSDEDAIFIEPGFGSESELTGNFDDRLRVVLASSLGGSRLVSSDGRYMVIAAEMLAEFDTHEEVSGPAKAFQNTVRAQIAATGADVNAYFAGIAFTRVSAIGHMQGDLLLLAPITTLVLAVLLWILFRDLRLVLLVQLSIGLSIVVTAGIIRLFDDHINQLTVIYPVLLMVVVTANSLHILHRYFSELNLGLSAVQAMQIAVVRTVKACWLSSMTTAVGFFSLMLSDMFILRTFGLYLACGILAGFFIVTAFIPAMLTLLKIDKPLRREQGFISETITLKAVQHLVARLSVQRNARLLNLFSILAIGFLMFSTTNMRYDYSLSGMLRADDPIAQGNQRMDEHLSGIVPIEISLVGEKDIFKSPAVLRMMDELGQWFVDHYAMAAPKSLASVVKELNGHMSGQPVIPDQQEAGSQLLLLAESSPDHAVQQLVTTDYDHARIRATTQDLGAAYIVAMQQLFDEYQSELLRRYGLEHQLRVRMTGEAPVAYQGMNRLSEDLFNSVLSALLVIAVTILIVFRDFKLTLASLVPNILPIVLGLFVYRLTSDVIDPLPGIAFCIAIGIAVDDTIHLMARFREEPGGPDRLQRTLIGVVHPLINSSVILCAGFLVLLLSSFHWNQMLGFLVALMIAAALVCDLILTPAVLVTCDRDHADKAG